MLKKLSVLSASLFSAVAVAHPGHDHSHWSAVFLHALWWLPAVIAVGAAVYFVMKKNTKK